MAGVGSAAAAETGDGQTERPSVVVNPDDEYDLVGFGDSLRQEAQRPALTVPQARLQRFPDPSFFFLLRDRALSLLRHQTSQLRRFA